MWIPDVSSPDMEVVTLRSHAELNLSLITSEVIFHYKDVITSIARQYLFI